MKYYCLFTLLILLQSCGIVEDENITKKENPPVEFSSQKQLSNLINLQTLTTDHSISDKVISHLDSAQNYSIGFNCRIDQLFEKSISRVKVKVKYFFPRSGNASVVCAVSEKDSMLYWNAIPLDYNKAENKWNTSEFNFDLNNFFSGTEYLTVYVWSPSQSELYVEDIYIKPKK